MIVMSDKYKAQALPPEIRAGSILPLALAPPGQIMRLVEIRASRRLARRLAELGMTPGVTLRIVQANGGPLLISVRGSRIAIGRGLAHKLLVTIATATDAPVRSENE